MERVDLHLFQLVVAFVLPLHLLLSRPYQVLMVYQFGILDMFGLSVAILDNTFCERGGRIRLIQFLQMEGILTCKSDENKSVILIIRNVKFLKLLLTQHSFGSCARNSSNDTTLRRSIQSVGAGFRRPYVDNGNTLKFLSPSLEFRSLVGEYPFLVKRIATTKKGIKYPAIMTIHVIRDTKTNTRVERYSSVAV